MVKQLDSIHASSSMSHELHMDELLQQFSGLGTGILALNRCSWLTSTGRQWRVASWMCRDDLCE